LFIAALHEWPRNPNQAVRIQLSLRPRLNLKRDFDNPKLVAAVDTAYNDMNNRLYAAAVILNYPGLDSVDRALAEMEADFPYIPALLTFREGPVILKTLSRLKLRPDVIIYPGHGIAHPRSLGLASHLGILTDIPSIGCSRRCLIGDYHPLGKDKGCLSTLYVENKEVGCVYRTKDDVKPIFISPGYKCGINDATQIIVRCLRGYRMPEPLRLAHLYVNKYKRSILKKGTTGERARSKESPA
jgi:deoxyribonuclease V